MKDKFNKENIDSGQQLQFNKKYLKIFKYRGKSHLFGAHYKIKLKNLLCIGASRSELILPGNILDSVMSTRVYFSCSTYLMNSSFILLPPTRTLVVEKRLGS